MSTLKVININPTADPDVLEFVVHPSLGAKSKCYRTAKSASRDLLAANLVAIEGLNSVFYSGDRVTVSKTEAVLWSDLIDPICDAIEEATVKVLPPAPPLAPRPPRERVPESLYMISPMDKAYFRGKILNRILAKRTGFKKRSIKKTETWEYCFKSAYECDHKIVIAVLLQVDKEGIITNTYAEVYRVYITLMGEGKSDLMGNELFPDDMEKAEEAILGALHW